MVRSRLKLAMKRCFLQSLKSRRRRSVSCGSARSSSTRRSSTATDPRETRPLRSQRLLRQRASPLHCAPHTARRLMAEDRPSDADRRAADAASLGPPHVLKRARHYWLDYSDSISGREKLTSLIRQDLMDHDTYRYNKSLIISVPPRTNMTTFVMLLKEKCQMARFALYVHMTLNNFIVCTKMLIEDFISSSHGYGEEEWGTGRTIES